MAKIQTLFTKSLFFLSLILNFRPPLPPPCYSSTWMEVKFFWGGEGEPQGHQHMVLKDPKNHKELIQLEPN